MKIVLLILLGICLTPSMACGSCRDGQVCDTTKSECVDRCAEGNCESGVCNTKTGLCVACLETKDCKDEKKVCDTTKLECVDRCAEGSCESGVCDTNTALCVECLENQHCGEGICDKTSRECVGCLENQDCSAGVCDKTAKERVGCLENKDCSDGKVCDTTEKKCVDNQFIKKSALLIKASLILLVVIASMIVSI